MPLYYFNVRDAYGLVRDEEGIDLPDLHAVYREALRSVREFLADGGAPEPMEFEVTDEHGQVVLRLPIQNPHNKRLAASRARSTKRRRRDRGPDRTS